MVDNDFVTALSMLTMKEISRSRYAETINALVSSLKAKDEYTKRHCERVAYYSKLIAKELHYDINIQQKVYLGGLLHDIGKIGIHDSILKKSTKLTNNEYDEIKKHPEIGCQIISGISFLEDIIPMIKYHHERIDGKGYPLGLNDNYIPIFARIIAIADSFDAMTSDRNYRAHMTVYEAMAELKKNSGKQFDKDIAKKFIKVFPKYKEEIEKKFNHKFY